MPAGTKGSKATRGILSRGPIADLVRSFDWSSTPLGPFERWPASLAHFTRMILELPTPAIIFWGPQQTQIYITVTRFGFAEEAYFTFTFSPLRDDDGVIQGIYQPVNEVTAAVLASRRNETLSSLSNIDDVGADNVLPRGLSKNPRDLPFALLFLDDQGPRGLRPVGHTDSLDGKRDRFGGFEGHARRALAEQQPILVDDVVELLGGAHLGPPASLAAPRAPMHVKPRRILVIEDNLDGAQAMKDLLELSGHEVVLAHDGIDGVAQAREHHPEVILCDIGLPGMDGYQVAREIRADASIGEPMLVALTGYALPEDLKRAFEAGFDLHLSKPPELSVLEDVLAEGHHGSRG